MLTFESKLRLFLGSMLIGAGLTALFLSWKGMA